MEKPEENPIVGSDPAVTFTVPPAEALLPCP
jgi:hypothetical protein